MTKSRRRRDFFKGKVPQKLIFLQENRPVHRRKAAEREAEKESARKEHSGAGMFPWLARSKVREQAVWDVWRDDDIEYLGSSYEIHACSVNE